MKRILAVLLMVMLFVAAMPATSLAAGAVSNGDTTMYHVGTQRDDLMLRSGPGTNYAILARLGKNMALIKLSGDSNGWCRVKTVNGMSGYASSKYVKKNAYADVDTQRDGLNVRSSRNASNKKNIKGSIPHGTRHVTVTKINGNWAYVKWGKLQGWASLSYLKWSR